MRQLILSFLLASPLLVAAQGVQPAPSLRPSSVEPSATLPPSFSTPAWVPKVNGTVRSKWEMQHEVPEHRFELRNARLSFTGEAMRGVSYKAEVDLSDEGRYRTLDVFGEVSPFVAMEREQRGHFTLRMGQFRVPFSIDPHRSPHLRFFANRSFLSKQLGNVRDVGLMATYGAPLGSDPRARWELRAGVFNGSGITAQKNYWTRSVNYSARLQLVLPFGLTTTLSSMKVRPACGDVYLHDACFTYEQGAFTLEAEYLSKHYADNKFQHVTGYNLMALYTLPLSGAKPESRALFDQLSVRARYDYMGDHSDGSLNAKTGQALHTDAERGRITGGLNFRFARRHAGKTDAQLRLNYEKYLYAQPESKLVKPSDHDKALVELVVRF